MIPTIRISVDGAIASLRSRAQGVVDAARIGLKEGAEIVQAEARQNHPSFTTRSGDAERSVSHRTQGETEVVFLDTGVAAYSPFLHQGTGVYGPSGQPIRARNGRALRFEINGVPMFRRQVRGIRGDQFLYRAADTALPRVTERLRFRVDQAIAKGNRVR